MNPLLKKAAQECELPLKKFRQAFPVELTVWVRTVVLISTHFYSNLIQKRGTF